MIHLDRPTILAVAVVFSFLFGVIGWLFFRRFTRLTVLKYLFIGDLCATLGYGLFFFRESVDPFFGVIVANTAFHFCFRYCYLASLTFTQKKKPIWRNDLSLWLIALQVILMLYFLYGHENIEARVIVMVSCIVGQLLITERHLITDCISAPAVGKVILQAALVGAVVLLLVHLILVLGEPDIQDHYARRQVSVLVVLGAVLLILVKNLACILSMLTESFGKLEKQSLQDPLTGLYNRRAFDMFLDREVSRVGRYKQPVSMVMCDIDHFKAFNDQYGHVIGDKVLILFSRELLVGRRISDVVARVGGEEFLILLPDTNLEGAIKVSNTIRERLIESLVVPGVERTISASFGVAQYSDQESLECFRKRVDEALYQAKRSGRDCIKASHTLLAVT